MVIQADSIIHRRPVADMIGMATVMVMMMVMAIVHGRPVADVERAREFEVDRRLG